MQVWVVDDQASFRLATAATLSAMDDFVMAGECETGESAIELIPDGGVGIVLMDIHMPGMGGIEATRRLCAAHPDLLVVLMSTYDVEDLPAGAADCGAAITSTRGWTRGATWPDTLQIRSPCSVDSL